MVGAPVKLNTQSSSRVAEFQILALGAHRRVGDQPGAQSMAGLRVITGLDQAPRRRRPVRGRDQQVQIARVAQPNPIIEPLGQGPAFEPNRENAHRGKLRIDPKALFPLGQGCGAALPGCRPNVADDLIRHREPCLGKRGADKRGDAVPLDDEITEGRPITHGQPGRMLTCLFRAPAQERGHQQQRRGPIGG